MINKMKMRKGGYRRGVSNSAKYLLKTNPQGDAIDCSIERLEGESDQAYANRIEKVFESARVPNQQNLYQFNSLSLHPSEGDKFTDAQMIEMAKEVYLKNGVKNGLSENRHTMFVVERNTKHHHVHAMIHLTDLETKKVNNKMIDYNPIIKKLELKYGLYNEHRKPKDEDEYKKTFKKELKAILDNALTASEFLMLANGAGFDIHHSAKEAYSLTKDDQTFKASDLAVSYKTLKAALGDDPEFAATLASLHTDKPGNDDSGSITAPVSEAPSQDPAPSPSPSPSPANKASASAGDDKRRKAHDDDDSADHDSSSSNEEKTKFVKGPRNKKTLYVNYHHDADGNYFFNRNDKKAFEYDAKTGTVKYQGCTPSSVKAGLQKLSEDGNPCVLYTGGGAKFKRETWMQFHLMNMADKGYTLEGFKPSLKDVEELERKIEERDRYYNRDQESIIKTLPTEQLVEPTATDKAQLEKMKLENPAFKNPVEENNMKALPTEKPDEKSSIGDSAKGSAKEIASTTRDAAAGLLEGLVKAAVDVLTSKDTVGLQSEMLSEMRVLAAQAEGKKQNAESEHHQNKKSRGPQYRP